MENKDSTNKERKMDYVVSEIRRRLNEMGYETPDSNEFFDGLNRLYRKPSLTQVVSEELPLILEYDPSFFVSKGIEVPEKLEGRLFDIYFDRYGSKKFERIIHSTKVLFRHIRYFLITNPDKEELQNTFEEFRLILNGSA